MAAVPYAAKKHLEKLRELSLRFNRQDEPQEIKDLGEVLDEAYHGIEMAFEDLPAADSVAESLRSAVKAVTTM